MRTRTSRGPARGPAVCLVAVLAACAAAPTVETVPAAPTDDPALPIRRLAVIDLFYPGDDAFESEDQRQFELLTHDAVDIDGDRRRDPYYHGDIVGILASGEGIEVLPYPIHDIRDSKGEILRCLRTIAAEVRGGERIDAVLLAWESSTLLSVFGETVDPARVEEYQSTLLTWSATSESWRKTMEIILAIENLTASGTVVYTIAGNSGRGSVNTYSFARGVRTVGAIEPGARERWISHNPLVSLVAKSAFRVRLVRHPGCVGVGYDIDEDGVADIPADRLSGHARWPSRPPRDSWVVLKGSSFAAPTAVRKILAAAP
jgi:hypothetical protein